MSGETESCCDSRCVRVRFGGCLFIWTSRGGWLCLGTESGEGVFDVAAKRKGFLTSGDDLCSLSIREFWMLFRIEGEG